jgi:hypothetical protein
VSPHFALPLQVLDVLLGFGDTDHNERLREGRTMHIRDEELAERLDEHTEGATLHAAVFARVPTGVGFLRMLTPLGNYFIARPAARQAAQKATERTELPLDAAVVLGISDDALHVWSADPMLNQVGDYLGHLPLARVAGMQATPGRTWQKLLITLEKGEEVELEARGAAHAVVAAYRGRIGQPN